MSTPGSSSGVRDRAEHGGRDQRQVALEVDDDVVLAVRVQRREGCVDAVGAGGERRVGQHRQRAGRANDLGELGLGAGDGNGADGCLQRALDDVEDHGPAGDQRERLAWQARAGHAGGDHDDGVHVSFDGPRPG